MEDRKRREALKESSRQQRREDRQKKERAHRKIAQIVDAFFTFHRVKEAKA